MRKRIARVRDGHRGIRGGGKDDEIEASPSFFSKLFQIHAVLLQAFPKKALAVLCDFRGLQGSRTKRALSKFFLPHRPPFDRVLGVIAPHSTGSRSVGTSAICVAGERGRVHGRKSSSGLVEART